MVWCKGRTTHFLSLDKFLVTSNRWENNRRTTDGCKKREEGNEDNIKKRQGDWPSKSFTFGLSWPVRMYRKQVKYIGWIDS